jgi:hypothetical protein
MTVIYDLPFADYISDDYLSFHRTLAFEHSPLKYRRLFVTKEAPPQEETAAMRIGRATHCLVLEGEDAFNREYIVRPETYVADRGKDKGEAKPWNSNALVCQEWEAAAGERGLTPISGKEFTLMGQLRASVRGNIAADQILSTGAPEVSLRQVHTPLGLKLQGRLDWLTPELGVADLKTTADFNQLLRELERLRLFALDAQARRTTAYQYVRQLAWYRDLVQEEWAEGDRSRYFLIIVEKEEPYRCAVIEIGRRLLDIASADNAATLIRLASAYADNVWPGGPEGVVAIDYTGPEPEEVPEPSLI